MTKCIIDLSKSGLNEWGFAVTAAVRVVYD